ncbi:ROK family transcriptional regulator [Hoeflea poritis]|uniref:ROK family transcriptional regulator n=1 Tax=Hoeflea poritis TaxID=2993659 RepID=A0ABT4VJF1_9HYPH|nr:ROK family transcriptional regulator [Hoeflea poritis]MDA4844252.1 ROK family transcriptional regulator [Hoeflea poritis]
MQPDSAARDDAPRIKDPSGGSNQTRVRAHNERLVMSLVRRHGSLAKAEIARRTGLSPQTVSVIMRALEKDSLLIRGDPVRGRVGQPSIPMALNPDAVFSVGLKIGRRSADLVLMDFVGGVRRQLRETFAYPLPDQIMQFAESGLEGFRAELDEAARNRITGIGIASPFELWNWLDQVGAPSDEMDAWREFDFAEAFARVTDLPVIVQNDATAACGAELVFGRGREFADFAYFYVGSFIGGGLVLNHAVFTGRTGNAGAFGPIPVPGPDGRPRQLLNQASIFVLENRLKEAGLDPSPLWLNPDDWPDFGDILSEWIIETARNIAIAALAIAAIIDTEAVLIDGGFPEDVRKRLVEAVRSEFEKLDRQGIQEPRIVEAEVGAEARVIGGASLPIFNRFMIDQNVLIKEPV